MDPNTTLAQIRATIVAMKSPDCTTDQKALLADDLIEQVEALDRWMSTYGFAPEDWKWGDDT